MKKIILLLFIAFSITAYAQKTDLTTVNTVKPKLGQKIPPSFTRLKKKFLCMKS